MLRVFCGYISRIQVLPLKLSFSLSHMYVSSLWLCALVCLSGEKPFECELCHKRFSRRDKLNMHSRSHTGERPHKCKYCAYAAADSSSLKKHLRIHYDERPFKCQICPYASRNSSQLTVHLRSHTGDSSALEFTVYAMSAKCLMQ